METTPIQNVPGTTEAVPVDIQFFGISLGRLVFLSVITLGLYEIYWFYRNWRLVRDQEGGKIKPVLRAIGAIFYCEALFKKIFSRAIAKGFKEPLPYGILAGIWVVVTILTNLSGRIKDPTLGDDIIFYCLTLIAIYPIAVAQQAINLNNQKLDPNWQPIQKFTKGEFAIIVLGLLSFLVVVSGTLFTDHPAGLTSFGK